MTGRLTPAEQLAALEHLLAGAKPRRTRPHPETDCPCQPCVERDMALEARAEARAEDRQWATGREADVAADRYFGSAS